MRVLLVQPPLDSTDNARELKALDDNDNTLISVGLYSIATVLMENGHEVSLINQTTTPWSDAIREILQYRPDLIGITCLSHNRHAIMKLADAVKERMPSAKIALGGIHASTLFSLILQRHPSIDYIAIGEAETSFLELVTRLDKGESTAGIKGIVQRKSGADARKPIIPISAGGSCDAYANLDWAGPADPIMELGRLPIPAKYFKYSVISTARGCPFNCTFCSSPQIWGRNVRYRPIEHVMEELSLLRHKHGMETVFFKDETFTMNKKRVIQLCKAMVEAKLNMVWTCDTRVDCLDEEALYWMRKAGCYYMSVGVESGSEAMLAQIDKKTNLAKIKNGTMLARKHGFWLRYYIIANLPGETNQDRQASIDIIEECKPHYVSVSLLKLSPGTEIYRRYCKENNRDDTIWFDEKRFWIPYSEEESWNSSDVGKNLLSYKFRSDKSQLFAYTEAELRDIQSRLSDCFGPNLELAMHLMQQNSFAEAIRYFQLALDIYPDYTKGRISLGICLLNLNRLTEAKALFGELGEKAGDNPIVWFMLGNTQLRLEAYREAETCYRKALALQPDYVEAWGQLGNVLESLGRYEEALAAFKKILALVPGEPQAGKSMIRVFKAMKQQRVSQ